MPAVTNQATPFLFPATTAASATVNDILIIFVSPTVNVSFSSIMTRKKSINYDSVFSRRLKVIPILFEKPRPMAGASHTHRATLLHNGL